MDSEERGREWLKWILFAIVSGGYLRVLYEMYRPFME